MGFGRKVGAFLGLVPDEERPYGDGEEYGESYSDGYGPEYAPPAATPYVERSPGYQRDSYHSEADDVRPVRRGFSAEPVTQGSLAVKPVAAEPITRREADTNAAARPATVKLTGFGEARVIGEKYRDGLSVILDMTDMSDSDARRLVDFSAGLAFAMRGSIEKVAPKVFMLLPPDADVAGLSTSELLQDAQAYARR